MARKFLTPIDLTKLEIQNVALQNLGSDPGTPATGQIYYNTGGSVKVYNGTSWLSLSTTGGTVTSVTGTSPVVSSGGTTPAISLDSGYGDTLNPYASKSANTVLAAPNGSTGTPSFRSLAAADIPSTLNGTTFSGNIAMGNNKITGLGTPTGDAEAATKAYVDNVSAGINIHDSVAYATTGALGTTGNLVGGTITTTYSNGTSGLGATLTIATSSNWTAITIDGQSLTVTDRVLIKNQVAGLQNGIYTVTQVGAVGNTTSFIFTRAVDNDQSPEIDAGDLTYVVAGTTNGGDGYVQTTANITIGTTAVSWTQFSGAGAVPLATISSAGIASFPTAQFSVDAAGAVTIDNLAGEKITSGTVADARIASALTGKSYNKLSITAPATGATLAITNLKTFSVSNSLTLAGTDSTTMTFPSTSATIARTDAAQTFTGIQTVQAASTQDAVKIAGRAGGTSSYAVTLTPATLAGSVTLTLPSSQATQGFTLARTLTGTVVVSTGTGTITHNMSNQYVLVQIFDNSTNALVDMDVTLATANTVTVAATTDATYRYVIIG
jgi:hypothetical protein